MTRAYPGRSEQYSLADLDPTLDAVTFVVVDLETTGGSADRDGITEIGAVKVRGGEVIGEFATLVNPGRPIPPQIVMLTSITDLMVADAPSVDQVLPSFLEFIAGAVLVAHNAPFDIGFLRRACRRTGRPWPNPTVIDTVRLARAVLPRQEAPSVRLGVLASLLGATVVPDHRALSDARATVDVLHALIGRLGSSAVDTLPDLVAAQRAVDPARRRRRHLADHLPEAPGVYLFRGADDTVLYIGTSTNLRARVRSYFTAAETRTKMRTMLTIAQRVDHVVCATTLEALIREQRLIGVHQPPYNQRSKNPGREYYLQWSGGNRARLVTRARTAITDADRLGPFTSRGRARHAADLMSSPTVAAATGPDQLRALWQGRGDDLFATLKSRMEKRAALGEFDAAARCRDDLIALINGVDKAQQLTAFAVIAELLLAAPDGVGGWELTLVRHGRLAAADRARRGVDPLVIATSLISTAETVPDPGPGLSAAAPEETWTLLTYALRREVRLVSASQPWALPVRSAASWRPWSVAAAAARDGQRYDHR